MKVLLIQPPIQDFYSTPQRIYPLGLLYLGTILKKYNFDVKILDACKSKKFSIQIPSEFKDLKEFYKENQSPFSLFKNYYHFGLDFLEIEKRIREFSPQIVGISVNFIPYIEEALRVCQLIKKVNEKIFVVVGGNAVSLIPEIFLQKDYIDFLIKGEGEFSFLKLCLLIKDKNLDFVELSKIEGIGFKYDGKCFLAPGEAVVKDLDALPTPDRSLLNPDAYKIGKKRFTQILSTRGCPKRCEFCSLPNRQISIFRKRTIKNVLEEIDICVKKFNIEFFDFEDDNFTADKTYALKLLNSLRQKYKDTFLEFSFMNGLDTEYLDLEILELLKSIRVRKLDFSLVTSDETLRKELKRTEPVANFTRIVLLSHSLGFKITSHIILGLPGSNLEKMLEDILFLAQLPTLLGASIFYLVPKSSIFEKRKDSFKTYDYKKWRLSFGGLYEEKKDTFFCFYLVRLINFLKELTDNYFSSSRTDLCSLLNELLKDYKINFSKETISVDNKIPKYILGIILILKLIKEKKIYRVVLEKNGSKLKYSFIEDFPSVFQIQKFLDKFNNKRLITQKGKELRLNFSF